MTGRSWDRQHAVGLAVLFAGSVALGCWAFDYVFVLQYDTPASFFLCTRAFLYEWLDHPGGLLLYGGRFLRQFYHYTLLGAVVVAAVVTLLGLLIYRIRRALADEPGLFHTLFPCVALLCLDSISTLTLGVLATCAAYLGYLHLRPGLPRYAGALLLLPLVYVTIGGYAWVLVAWILSTEALDRRARTALVFALLVSVVAVALPLVAHRWVYQISFRAAWHYPLDWPDSPAAFALGAYLLAIPLLPRLAGRSLLPAKLPLGRQGLLQAGLVAVATAATVLALRDADAARLAACLRLYRARQWDAIIDRARRHPSRHGLVQFIVNRALSERGRLLDEMFHYRQPWGPRGLILSTGDPAEDLRLAMFTSDLYFALGHQNAAYRQAYNQVNLLGWTYANLRRLTQCTVINGSHDIAAKYIQILGSTLFHADFARAHRNMIAAPGSTAYADLRSLRPRFELDMDIGEVAVLLSLLESNPRNRQALEYLIAWCLLDRVSLSFVAGELPRFCEAGYTRLPVHLQEGLLVWQSIAGHPVDHHGLAPSRRTATRFQQFQDDSPMYYAGGPARRRFEEIYGDTYMFYYALTTTPSSGTPPGPWLRIGNEFRSRGRLSDAVRCYRQALLRDPQSAEAQLLLARATAALEPDMQTPREPSVAPSRPDTADLRRLRPTQKWNLRSH